MSSSVVPSVAAGRAFAPTRRALDRVSRYPRQVRPAVTAIARSDGRFADLALSFPALLVAVAEPRRGLDVAAARALVRKGAPLAAVAKVAGVPMWLRPLRPEAFAGPVPELPDSSDLRLRLANFVPRERSFMPIWLSAVAAAHEAGTSEFVVWTARHVPNRRYIDCTVSRIGLFAWYSTDGRSTVAGGYADRPWHPDMAWGKASEEAARWLAALAVAFADGVAKGVVSESVRSRVLGYDFVPLVTMADVCAEASVMDNCLRSYALDVGSGRCRLVSMRLAGVPVATIELGSWQDDPFPRIVQLKARRNATAGVELWRAAHRWLARQDAWQPGGAPSVCGIDRRVWRDLWRPYWMARKRVPRWLPAEPLQSFDEI